MHSRCSGPVRRPSPAPPGPPAPPCAVQVATRMWGVLRSQPSDRPLPVGMAILPSASPTAPGGDRSKFGPRHEGLDVDRPKDRVLLLARHSTRTGVRIADYVCRGNSTSIARLCQTCRSARPCRRCAVLHDQRPAARALLAVSCSRQTRYIPDGGRGASYASEPQTVRCAAGLRLRGGRPAGREGPPWRGRHGPGGTGRAAVPARVRDEVLTVGCHSPRRVRTYLR